MNDAINELFTSGGASVEKHPTEPMPDFQTMSERAKAMSQDKYAMGCEKTTEERLVGRIN